MGGEGGDGDGCIGGGGRFDGGGSGGGGGNGGGEFCLNLVYF